MALGKGKLNNRDLDKIIEAATDQLAKFDSYTWMDPRIVIQLVGELQEACAMRDDFAAQAALKSSCHEDMQRIMAINNALRGVVINLSYVLDNSKGGNEDTRQLPVDKTSPGVTTGAFVSATLGDEYPSSNPAVPYIFYEALRFYADEHNYRINGQLDPNSPYFTGPNRALDALRKEGSNVPSV